MTDPHDHLALTVRAARRALRFWLPGLTVLVVGLGLTLAGHRFLPRSYRSEAVVLYRAGVGVGDPALQAESDSPRQVIARVTELLTARSRLEALIGELHLYPQIVAESGPADAVEELRTHLAVTVREGLSFRLTFDAPSPELAQQVLDKIVTGVITEDARLRRERASQAQAFFDARKKEIDGELGTREVALSAFLALHPELAVEAAASTSKAGATVRGSERLRAHNDPMNRLSLQIQAAQIAESIARARQAPQPRPVGEPRPAAALDEAYQLAQRELAEAQAKYTPAHPAYQAAQRRVKETQSALQRLPADPARPADAPGDSAGLAGMERTLRLVNEMARMGGDRPAASAPAGGAPRAARLETEWARLAREADEARDRSDLLETRQFQAAIWAELIETGDSGKVVVVDAPYRPLAPVAGRRTKLAVAGGGGALCLALALMVLLGVRDDRLYGADEVRALFGATAPVVLRLAA
jgi:uncharacterized protein involved in exopolysaccharide biosynthesis